LRAQGAVLPEHSRPQIPRDLHEDARDVARAHAATPEYVEACRRRKKVEMLFAHLKRDSTPHALAPKGSKWRKRRVPARGDRSKPQAPRPLETYNRVPRHYASVNAAPPATGRQQSKSITDLGNRGPAEAPPNPTFSTVSANSGHCLATCSPACRLMAHDGAKPETCGDRGGRYDWIQPASRH
jgi:hypothetical protein